MAMTRATTKVEYRMERLDGGKWVEMPYINLTLVAHKERLEMWRRENPTETYRLATRTVTTTSWLEIPEEES